VVCTTADGDSIGSRLCTALRDQIASSPRYTDLTTEKSYWTLHLVSIADDVTTEGTENTSAEAVTLTITAVGDTYELYVRSWIFVTGAHKAKEQAETILANTDGEIQTFVVSGGKP
jgi:hypothetical protein